VAVWFPICMAAAAVASCAGGVVAASLGFWLFFPATLFPFAPLGRRGIIVKPLLLPHTSSSVFASTYPGFLFDENAGVAATATSNDKPGLETSRHPRLSIDKVCALRGGGGVPQ
jgi:hypothetical protein